MTPPHTPGVNLTFFADDTCIYAREPKEIHFLIKLQSSLIAMEALCEYWKMKINEDKTRDSLTDVDWSELILH